MLQPRLSLLCSRLPVARQFSTNSALCRAFKEGDVVILRDKNDNSREGTLTTLRANKTSNTHRGIILHEDIIGKQPRQVARSKKGTSFRIHEPTLAEYVRLTPRLVTPIYPSDTNLIVSLLDLHVDTFSATDPSEPPLEILEAGTGHGALTLHLSRAIHAANPPPPKAQAPVSIETGSENDSEDASFNGESASDLQEMSLNAWKSSRCAILHTLDISSKHSKHARKIVSGFRHGMYSRNVDFHVGDISGWIASQRVLRNSKEPFLSHVFLDLPNADRHMVNVASALRVNGLLAVFNPSITQIAECVKKVKEERLPYLLDQVIELGAGNIRKWDVKAVQPRATLKGQGSRIQNEGVAAAAPAAGSSESEAAGAVAEVKEGLEARDNELAADLAKNVEEWVMVCRPKAGEMVVGGGFLALWRRMEPPAAVASEKAETSEGEVSE